MTKPTKKSGVRAIQPKSIWERPVAFDGWGLFKAVAQIATSLFKADSEKAIEKALEAVQCIKFKDRQHSELAWALVSTEMTRAVVSVVRLVGLRVDHFIADRPQK